MYIRKTSQKNKKTGKEYLTYRLVESYRNAADGKVKQEILLNLGTNFEISPEKWPQLSSRISEIVSGQQSLLPPDDNEIEELAQSIAKRVVHRSATTKTSVDALTEDKYYNVDIDSLKHQQIRQIGSEYVCVEAIKQLGLDQLLKEANFNNRQINTAIGTIVGRLVAPGSERSTHKYLQNYSALDELLNCDFQQLKLDNLYCIADKILHHKKTLEEKLFAREKTLFKFNEVITLYDLTNTYFEGRSESNTNATFGRSKEKRFDCPIVTLALVLDASGFPKKSEIYEGNVSEAKTLEKMIHALEGTVKPTVVLDAGIASEDNIAWLKTNGYTYIVVSKKNKVNIPYGCEAFLLYIKNLTSIDQQILEDVINKRLGDENKAKDKHVYLYDDVIKSFKHVFMRNEKIDGEIEDITETTEELSLVIKELWALADDTYKKLDSNNLKIIAAKTSHIVPDDIAYTLQHKKDYLIQATLIKNPKTQESELYCYSKLKEKKEQGMRTQACLRYEAGLNNILISLKVCNLYLMLENSSEENIFNLLQNSQNAAYVACNGMLYAIENKALKKLEGGAWLEDVIKNLEVNNNTPARLTDAQIKIIASNTKHTYFKSSKTSKEYEIILERIGRLKEKYKSVGYAYAVEIITDKEKKNAIDIKWKYLEEKQKAAGTYCLRSNCDDLDEQTLWDIYITLTELEAAFRCLKSELGMRPVYHQITKRVDSHIFISVLAYHILHTIRYQLKQYGINDSWETIKKDLQLQCRITSTMNCKDGKKIHIRKTSSPTPRQLEIYRALGIPSSPGKTEKSIF